MDLKTMYAEVASRIDAMDFSALFSGFTPFSFALYDESACVLDGEYIQKTDAFIGNTAILYNNAYIAIWNVTSHDSDMDVLAAKIVHEMFHAFQHTQKEERFPSELEVLTRYEYKAGNLTMKMKEHRILIQLLEHFDSTLFKTFLQLRAHRKRHFPYEYAYESAVEQIEGTANYVEMEALKQLDASKYDALLVKKQKQIVTPEALIPVRIMSYDVGALLFNILKTHSTYNVERITKAPFSQVMLKDFKGESINTKVDVRINNVIEKHHEKTRKMISKAQNKGECVLQGKYPLTKLNVYDARYLHPYAVSTFFVAYEDGKEETMLYGDCVMALDNDKDIETLYLMRDERL